MNRIVINENEYPCPLKFAMQKVANVVSSITTMSDKVLADTNGWTYDDITLKWEWIENTQLQQLLRDTETTFDFTFKDVAAGEEKTITAYRKSVKATETANTDHNGNLVWRGIEMQLAFPESYAYEE